MNTDTFKVISIVSDVPLSKEYVESTLYKIFSKYV